LPAADPARRGIDPEKITLYLRQVMVVGKGEVLGMAVWRDRLFAAMHLNPNLPAAYFVVPIDQAQPTSVIRARRETAPGSRISPAARGAGFNSERERRGTKCRAGWAASSLLDQRPDRGRRLG
jgi:hypothetical protein